MAYRAGEPRNDQWIKLDNPWSRVTGEKTVTLWAGDLEAKPTLLVGTKSGAVYVLDALTGELTAKSATTGSPVVRFLSSPQGVLAAHGDGTVESIALQP